MTDLNEVQRLVRQRLESARFASQKRGVTGILINATEVGTGNPPANKIWVRPDGQIEPLLCWHNNRVDPQDFNVPVIIQKNAEGQYEVLGLDNPKADNVLGERTARANTRQMDAEDFSTPIQPRLLTPFRITAGDEKGKVIIGPGLLPTAYYEGGTHTITTSINSGKARWVALSLNPVTGLITKTAGTEKNPSELELADITELDIPDFPLCAVALKAEATSFTQADIEDLRPLFTTRRSQLDMYLGDANVFVGNNGPFIYNRTGAPRRIVAVDATVRTPPTGDSIVYQIRINGSSIMASNGVIGVTNNVTTIPGTLNPSAAIWNPDAYLELYCATVGSGDPGAGLLYSITYVT